jgi:osmotically-inducible protein OsmY
MDIDTHVDPHAPADAGAHAAPPPDNNLLVTDGTYSDGDLDLIAELREMIYRHDAIRGSRAEVDADVRDGHVMLRGWVQSPMVAVEIEQAVAEWPGVTGFTDRLYDDGSLTRQVAEALATDPRTRAIPPGYEVTVIFGHVTLVARLSAEEAAAATAVAEAITGVRTVRIKTY